MILSQKFYDQCCPAYQKAIDEVEQKLVDIHALDENDDDDYVPTIYEQAKKTILKFSSRYLTPKDYWEYCHRLIDLDGDEDDDDQHYDINGEAYSHFYYNKKMNLLRSDENDDHIYLKLINFQLKEALEGHYYTSIEEDLDYPHSYLKQCYRQLEEHADSHPSKKLVDRYEEMKALYLKIKSAEDDVDTWFKLLLEVEDVDFVKHNVEYRLGHNLFNVKLWKLYIAYLKQYGERECLIKTYSKYCRFFLDDLEMLKEYKKAMIKYGHIFLPWDDLFDFEMRNYVNEEDDEDMESDGDESSEFSFDEDDESQGGDDVAMKEIVPLKNLCATFYDTYQVQNFSLPGPLILYILKNANHRVLRKLHSACKYFFAKMPAPICYRLETAWENAFNDESISIRNSSDIGMFIKNTYVTGRINVLRFYNGTVGNDFVSSLIPHLYRCNAKFIRLGEQHLSFKELKFLIANGSVINLDVPNSIIKNENDEFVELEKIMACLPNIEDLHLPTVKVNANTAHALANQKFVGKICNFLIFTIVGEAFDSFNFRKYCIANRDKRFALDLRFSRQHFDDVFIQKFKKIMNDYAKTVKNKNSCFRMSIV